MSAPDLHHRHHARNPVSIAILIALWAALIAARLWLGAIWLILLPAFLLSVPLAVDIWANRVSGFDLEGQEIRWFTGPQREAIPIAQLVRVRITTRLDLSHRITLLLNDGSNRRLPPGASPNGAALAAMLEARKIPVERRHFSHR